MAASDIGQERCKWVTAARERHIWTLHAGAGCMLTVVADLNARKGASSNNH